VLCITHLASIAACAQTHFTVAKEVKSDRTATLVRRLTEEDRVAEIARLFGGVGGKPGRDSISLKHARELLIAAKSG
jgi:DNA repair protein RecN (Recombination protein N)